ncbi:uncharacterized protein LOC104919560 [Larimichthys crocea]|uniref:uncharacterized protein LOC104919560 n=1 Tax=Larimichthys crocea TaxID=215358 RepID=UPI000F5F2F23|nr:uncharacterized protein LOC104919560 [Larimichthys crocea]
MSASHTMQKSLIFLLIIWNSSPFASGNATTNLQFSLGCQAVIPCQHCRRDSRSFKWYYKKDERSDHIVIFAQDATGIPRFHPPLQSRILVMSNYSLVIKNLIEDDQGLYWCENDCLNKHFPTVTTSLKKEILKETNETFYVTAGRNFTYSCPGEFNNLKWTVEASNTTALWNSAQRPKSDFVTSNKALHIVNVQRADVGKYSCWKSRCDGHWQKLFTIILCVATVHHSENSDVSCAMMCDEEFRNIKPNSPSNVETNRRQVHVDRYGFLNCTTKQMFDGYSPVNSTHEPSVTSNKTTDVPTQPEHVNLIYGTSAALTCLILMALLVCFLRPRLQAAFSIQLCCCGSNGSVDEEPSVVYTSIIIRRPAKTTDNYVSYSECVYSEIKV